MGSGVFVVGLVGLVLLSLVLLQVFRTPSSRARGGKLWKLGKIEDDEKKILLEHLGNQYKLYREEVRLSLGFAATSATLLVLLLFSELSAATNKDNPKPELLILLPLTLVWYVALLALFISHIVVAQEYSELIEQEMNRLLGYDVLQFESGYTFPMRDKKDYWAYGTIIAVIGFIPIGAALIAGYNGLKQIVSVGCPFYSPHQYPH